MLFLDLRPHWVFVPIFVCDFPSIEAGYVHIFWSMPKVNGRKSSAVKFWTCLSFKFNQFTTFCSDSERKLNKLTPLECSSSSEQFRTSGAE